MQPRFAIIGPGGVGSEVIAQAQRLKWHYGGSLGSGAIKLPDEMKIKPLPDRSLPEIVEYFLDCADPDVVFVSTPPFGDKGRKELEILSGIARYHAPTVICTKEVLAHLFKQLKDDILPYLPKFACQASVGGGTGILGILESRRVGEQEIVFEIAPNASTNFILSSKDVEAACKQAQEDGFLEPGEGPLHSKFDRECLDGVYKACAAFNRLDLGRGTYLTPDMIDRSPLTQKEFQNLGQGLPRRLVVSFSNKSTETSKQGPAGFYATCGGWVVSGGLRSMGIDWIPNGPSAAVRIFDNYELPFVASGRGAGVEATAEQMIRDAQHLLADKLRQMFPRSVIKSSSSGPHNLEELASLIGADNAAAVATDRK